MTQTAAALTQKQIHSKLAEWEKLRIKAKRIEDIRDAQVETLKDTFTKKSEPILTAAWKKLDPIVRQMAGLEEEIHKGMLAGVIDDVITIEEVETTFAVAKVKDGRQREIDAHKFFDAVPQNHRTADFWGCLKVLIGEAEKFSKDVVKRLAKTNHKYSVEVRLKK